MATKSAKKVITGSTPKQVEAVTREEFSSLKEDLNTLIGVVGKLADNVSKPAETVEPKKTQKFTGSSKRDSSYEDEDGSPDSSFDSSPLPIKYMGIVKKYFDLEDGFEFFLDGLYFSIVVPEDLSNAESAYLDHYKRDVRTKAVPPHDFKSGIDHWCKMVAKNLKYDLKAVRK